MAEFLIKKCTQDCTCTDADHWCNGDLVDLRKDNFSWGSGECLPHFYILKVPFLAVQDLSQYLLCWMSSSGTLVKQSKWKYIENSGVFCNKETNEIKLVPGEL